MARLSFLVASLLATYIAAAPIEAGVASNQQNTPLSESIRVALEKSTSRASCEGQSCSIADLSGSTPDKPKVKPVGGDKNGYICINKYNPEGIKAVMNAPSGPSQKTNLNGALTSAMAALSSATTLKSKDTGSFTGRCAKNILFFARGTTETGKLGITVGPVLSTGLSGPDWNVVGVPYDADMAGDNCLGLPGGMVAKDMINQAAKKCPDAKIFMSGYSEGGMVSHNGVAYADEDARKRVAAVITFGDPFQGALIKDYDGPILTFCNKGDAVCTGNFVVGAAHLSYTGGPAAQAIKEIKKIAAGGKVDN